MIVSQYDDTTTARSYLLVIIEQDNLRRMEQGDPITLVSGICGGFLRPIRFPTFQVVIAYEPPAPCNMPVLVALQSNTLFNLDGSLHICEGKL